MGNIVLTWPKEKSNCWGFSSFLAFKQIEEDIPLRAGFKNALKLYVFSQKNVEALCQVEIQHFKVKFWYYGPLTIGHNIISVQFFSSFHPTVLGLNYYHCFEKRVKDKKLMKKEKKKMTEKEK